MFSLPFTFTVRLSDEVEADTISCLIEKYIRSFRFLIPQSVKPHRVTVKLIAGEEQHHNFMDVTASFVISAVLDFFYTVKFIASENYRCYLVDLALIYSEFFERKRFQTCCVAFN